MKRGGRTRSSVVVQFFPDYRTYKRAKFFIPNLSSRRFWLKTHRLEVVQALAGGRYIRNGRRILEGEGSERELPDPFQDVTHPIGLRHVFVDAPAQGKNVLNVRGIRLVGMLYAPLKLPLRAVGPGRRRPEIQAQLSSEARPIGDNMLVVVKPLLGVVRKVKWDIR